MYIVYDRDKNIMMQSETNVRYDKETEKDLIQSGYTICLDGKKIK